VAKIAGKPLPFCPIRSVVLRATSAPRSIAPGFSEDGMTADWARSYDLLETISNRIVNEVRGVNRWFTTLPKPGTIEWE